MSDYYRNMTTADNPGYLLSAGLDLGVDPNTLMDLANWGAGSLDKYTTYGEMIDAYLKSKKDFSTPTYNAPLYEGGRDPWLSGSAGYANPYNTQYNVKTGYNAPQTNMNTTNTGYQPATTGTNRYPQGNQQPSSQPLYQLPNQGTQQTASAPTRLNDYTYSRYADGASHLEDINRAWGYQG